MILSVITINLNNREGLKRTMRSVTSQKFRDFEFILIDGNSTDGSKEIIRKNEGAISYWLSEKDNGIYDAMNKGILRANGEYLLFLNSGDTLVSDETLINVIPTLGKHDIVYGNLKINDRGKIADGFMPDILSLDHMMKDTLWHPVSFIRKHLLEKGYSTAYRICGDYDFFFRSIIVDKVSYMHINEFIAEFNLEGLSSSPENIERIKNEKEMIQGSYLAPQQLQPFRVSQEKKSLFKKIMQWFR